jgi:hypothetical protein
MRELELSTGQHALYGRTRYSEGLLVLELELADGLLAGVAHPQTGVLPFILKVASFSATIFILAMCFLVPMSASTQQARSRLRGWSSGS